MFVLDTSALAKRYVAESNSSVIWELCDRDSVQIVFSRLGRLELASALNRRRRQGELTDEAHDEAWRLFEDHLERYGVIEMAASVLDRAETLLARHPLRAADAIHLASAIAIRDAGENPRFVTADRRQAEAAEAEGLDVWLLDA